MLVVDGHEDLAWNILTFRRDYTRSVKETRKLEAKGPAVTYNGHTLLGLDEWIEGRVAVVFASLFATPRRRCKGTWDTQCYDDEEGAARLYAAQADAYRKLTEDHPASFRLVTTGDDLDQILSSWKDRAETQPQVGLVMAMEGADAVLEPGQLDEWYERGVRMLAPAWAGTRYAGGTGDPAPFTSEGFALLDAMADLGLGLDLSHLAEEAVLQALDRFPGVLLASHSNSRELLPDSPHPDRHLSDVVIRRLGERDGVIGIVPYNRFLVPGWQPPDGRGSATVDHVIAHIDHVCQLMGDAAHVGLGSDFDGGFGLEAVPIGLDSVADLRSIGDRLRARGYAETDVEGVLSGNWLRLLKRVLPER